MVKVSPAAGVPVILVVQPLKLMAWPEV